MLTPFGRTAVSFMSLAAALTVGGCATLPHRTWDAADATLPAAVRFDNDADVSVDVYLISQRSEWRLGRVAPGARAMLNLPAAALSDGQGFLRLAAVPDAPVTVQPASDPRATLTIAQPLAQLLSQDWMFSLRQTASPQLLGLRANGMRP